MIERVEIVRGASSSLFGSYAMGGVVNIVTTPPNKSEGSGETLYGQNNRFQGNANYGHVVNDAVALSFNGNYYHTNGYYVVPSTRFNRSTNGWADNFTMFRAREFHVFRFGQRVSQGRVQ